jgi:SWI/SNF-related matrix-associated actin-dependent regulator of chromatin subfamily B member 1
MHQEVGTEAFDELIPIRIDLNVRGAPVTEYFTWDLTETAVSPTDFATLLVSDLQLPQQATSAIASSITDQIEANTTLRQSQRISARAEESRQILRLNIRVGRVVLRDQFEWDIADSTNCPEAFAERLCADLGLGREFVPAVACHVREQLLELADTEHPHPGCMPLDGQSVIRSLDVASAWQPVVERLNVTQQENLELKERREARLARRIRSRAPGQDKVVGPPITKNAGTSFGRLHRKRSSTDVC